MFIVNFAGPLFLVPVVEVLILTFEVFNGIGSSSTFKHFFKKFETIIQIKADIFLLTALSK